jgi:hypothetical protein
MEGPVAVPNNLGEDEEQQQLKMAMLAAQMGQAGSSSVSPVPPISNPSGMDQSTAPTTPVVSQPDVTLAHADYNSQPGAADTLHAQQALDKFKSVPLWKKALVPALIGAGSALGAHSWGGRQLQENAQQDIGQYVGNMRGQQDTLIKQLEFAKQQQQGQYEADQRNRQQDLIMQGNTQSRNLVAQIAAQSRQGVADTRADASRDVAGTRVEGAKDVAGINTGSRENIATAGNANKIEVAKINAQSALNRFLAGEGYQDRRQQAGFGHTDMKPTADEERRADLSEAMSGYADMIEDIATRRPELFGPLAGRVTQGRQMIGTNDPDVANLKFLREQVGITQMGAHSLRSAQAISPIADALVNSFHNDASTTIAAMKLAKKGVAQFIDGPVRPTVYPAGSPGAPGRSNPSAPTPLKSKVRGGQSQPEVWVRGPNGQLQPQPQTGGR